MSADTRTKRYAAFIVSSLPLWVSTGSPDKIAEIDSVSASGDIGLI